MTTSSVTLYCTEGGSDKIYKAELAPQGDEFVVNFWFGPRAGTLRPGTKTKTPMSLEKATSIFEKLVKSKKAKGYHEGENAPAYTAMDGTSRDTGIRPMLLTPDIEESIEKYINDSQWAAQEKKNGIRLLLKVENREVTGINRKGQEISIPKGLRDTVAECGPFILDGELIGDTYHAFDLLEANEEDHREKPYIDRYSTAGEVVEAINDHVVQLVSFAVSTAEKRKLVDELRAGQKEGIVFKKLYDSPYLPGKVASLKKAEQVKVKFYAYGEFLTLGWNDKQSLQLGAVVGGGDSAVVGVGNVTVPDKYVDEIGTAARKVIRVRYLFATAANKLYQPTLEPDDTGAVICTDHDWKDCPLSQLKHEGKD